MSEQQDKAWHVNREVSLGDMIAIVTALVAVVMAYMSLDGRVTVVELLTNKNSQQIESTISEIKIELRRLNDRLERIVEGGTHK